MSSNSHRNTAASFINEHSLMNHMPVSPRAHNLSNVEQRGPYTMNTNCSRTNFIEESSVLPEGPRAFAVTATGEKHYIPLEADAVQSKSLNPYNLHGRNSTVIRSENTNQSSTHKRSSSSKKASAKENSNKQIKMSRHASRYLAQKVRLAFTPRSNVENVSSGPTKAFLQAQAPFASVMCNTNAQTQTDDEPVTTYLPSIVTNSSVPHIPPYTSKRQKHMMEPSIHTSKRVYSITDPNLKYYSDLRGIASVVTLITVLSWLVSTFFEIEFITDLLTNIIQRYRSWYATEEIPKTKAELVIQFLVNLWS